MEPIKSQPAENKSQKPNTKPQKKRNKRLLTKNGNQVLEAKFILDALMEQGTSLPDELKQAVSSARNAAWEAFKKEQEAQMQLFG
jgi:helix-turn-helix protein